MNQIGRKYASYVSCICTSLIEKGVTATNLSTYLLKLPALKFGPDEQHLKLLAGVRNELKRAETINDIVDLLDENLYASFLDYEVFQAIVDKYKLCCDDEILSYPKNLKAYVEKHKLSEFIAINPALSKMCTSDSEEITLKFEIDASNYKLGSLLKLKSSISDILGIKSSGLRLLRVEEGCVAITFVIPYFVAHHIFKGDKKFTGEEVKRFLDLSTLWLKCCDCSFTFKYNYTGLQQHSTIEHKSRVAEAVLSSAEAATSMQEFQNDVSDQQDELNTNYQRLLEAHQRLTENYRDQSIENTRLNQQIVDLKEELQALHRRSSPELQRVLDAQKSELDQLKLHQIPELRQSIATKNQEVIAARKKLNNRELELMGTIQSRNEEISFYKSNLEQTSDQRQHYNFIPGIMSKLPIELYEQQIKRRRLDPSLVVDSFTPTHATTSFTHPLTTNVATSFQSTTSWKRTLQPWRATIQESSSLNLGLLSNSGIAHLRPLAEKGKCIEAKVTSHYEVSYTPESRGRHTLTVQVNDEQTLHYDIFVEHPIEMIRSPYRTISNLPGASRVAVFKDDKLFTSDPTNRKYHIFDLHSCSLSQSIDCKIDIRGIAVDVVGNVYLTSSHWLYKYSAKGERVGAVGSDQPGNGDTSFNNPTGVQVNDDQIYVCDTDNGRILVFNPNLSFSTKFGDGMSKIRYAKGLFPQRLQKPEDIAFDTGVKTFVLDSEKRAVVVFERMVYSQAISMSQLLKPAGLCYRDGHLLVTDWAGRCFVVFKVNGEFVRKVDFSGTPVGICTDIDGYIYIANSIDSRVVVY